MVGMDNAFFYKALFSLCVWNRAIVCFDGRGGQWTEGIRNDCMRDNVPLLREILLSNAGG